MAPASSLASYPGGTLAWSCCHIGRRTVSLIIILAYVLTLDHGVENNLFLYIMFLRPIYKVSRKDGNVKKSQFTLAWRAAGFGRVASYLVYSPMEWYDCQCHRFVSAPAAAGNQKPHSASEARDDDKGELPVPMYAAATGGNATAMVFSPGHATILSVPTDPCHWRHGLDWKSMFKLRPQMTRTSDESRNKNGEWTSWRIFL